MRFIFNFLLLLATAAKMHAEVPLEWVPIDRPDDRVAVEIHLEFNADALPKKQNLVLYLIPSASATKEEKIKNRALEQGGVGPFKGAPGWGYSVAVISQPKDVLVELAIFSLGSSSTIEREASFQVEYCAAAKGERAGISFDIKWKKKPNLESSSSSHRPTPLISPELPIMFMLNMALSFKGGPEHVRS